jgi:hypothetical protein
VNDRCEFIALADLEKKKKSHRKLGKNQRGVLFWERENSKKRLLRLSFTGDFEEGESAEFSAEEIGTVHLKLREFRREKETFVRVDRSWNSKTTTLFCIIGKRSECFPPFLIRNDTLGTFRFWQVNANVQHVIYPGSFMEYTWDDWQKDHKLMFQTEHLNERRTFSVNPMKFHQKVFEELDLFVDVSIQESTRVVQIGQLSGPVVTSPVPIHSQDFFFVELSTNLLTISVIDDEPQVFFLSFFHANQI